MINRVIYFNTGSTFLVQKHNGEIDVINEYVVNLFYLREAYMYDWKRCNMFVHTESPAYITSVDACAERATSV